MYFYRYLHKVSILGIIIPLIIFTNLQASNKITKIVIIMPMKHRAMDMIVAGIKNSLADTNTKIIIEDAKGDINTLQTIIKQLPNDIGIIMPIGTSTCQNIVAHVAHKPIICVASLPITPKNPLVTGINDTIPITDSLSYFPFIKNIAVIYSTDEQIGKEVEELSKYTIKNHMKLHKIRIQKSQDLENAVRDISSEVQTFLILKDHLIVRNIWVLREEARRRSIPLIASDYVSVLKGATISIGVKDERIAMQAGTLVKKIMSGIPPSNLPFETVDSLPINSLSVYFNSKSFKRQKILTLEDIFNNKALKNIPKYDVIHAQVGPVAKNFNIGIKEFYIMLVCRNEYIQRASF